MFICGEKCIVTSYNKTSNTVICSCEVIEYNSYYGFGKTVNNTFTTKIKDENFQLIKCANKVFNKVIIKKKEHLFLFNTCNYNRSDSQFNIFSYSKREQN